MCRILVGAGRYNVLSNYYSELIRGLVGSAEYDPYLAKITNGVDTSHRDGWGRATLFIGLGKRSFYMYKSIKPIYIDRPSRDLPETKLNEFSDPYVIDLIHVRLAARGMPINFLSVHPFETFTRGGLRILIMHNGTVDKYEIAKEMRLPEKIVERYSDTFILLLKIADMIEDDIDVSILREIKRYVRSALNIGLLVYGEEKATLVVGSYYLDASKRDYYKIYVAELGDGAYVFSSSTLVDFSDYRPQKIKNWREIPNGTYYFLDIPYSTLYPEVRIETI
ncbi:MAG: class II glutamine amidotransferase [Sulfolobales archaeon]